MPVTAARARKLALALEDASAVPHFDRTAFRTTRRIFATLGPSGRDINFMFDPDLRDFYCAQAPDSFSPVPGGWGRMGATRCDLERVDTATFLSALKIAHARAMAPPAKRAKSSRAKKKS
jgi:hypothetical protein